MIVIKEGSPQTAFPQTFSYCHGWNLLTRWVLPITRYLRATNTEKYMLPNMERHLDIGCGDGYFLRRSKAKERYGLDHLLGDEISDLAKLPPDHFDCITMLAVIEHIEDVTVLQTHILRALKPKGRLVVTTPKKSAEWLIRLYYPGIEDQHETYFDARSIAETAGPGYKLIGHHTFIFGLNQAFCLEKQ